MNILLVLVLACIVVEGATKPNLVFMIADDLNAEFGAYVDDDHVMKGLTPNLDGLSKEGTTFLSAYCQFAVCSPSRQSMFSGRYPETLKIFNFEKWLPQVSPNLKSIGKYLIDVHGYTAYSVGKVFHDESTGTMPGIWHLTGHFSVPVMLADDNGMLECGKAWYCYKAKGSLVDSKISRASGRIIQRAIASNRLPFALFIGFKRPHMQNAIPRESAALVDTEKVRYPETAVPKYEIYDQPAEYLTTLSRYECLTPMKNREILLGRGALPVLNPKEGRNFIGAFTDQKEKYFSIVQGIRRNYYGAIAFVDENVGVVLNEIKAAGIEDSTIIIFTSDHGFSNGEKGIWCKNTLYETTNKVPLIISLPKQFNAAGQDVIRLGNENVVFQRNTQSRTLASLIDLFPTIVELVGGNVNNVDESGIPLDGKSLIPSIINPDTPDAAASYSQYPRCEPLYSRQTDDCGSGKKDDRCARKKVRFMGYSIRTEEYRYTEFREYNDVFGKCQSPVWEGMPNALMRKQRLRFSDPSSSTIWDAPIVQQELYRIPRDTKFGEWEKENLAVGASKATMNLMSGFSKMIQHRFKDNKSACSGRGTIVMDGDKETCSCIGSFKPPNCA